MNHGIGTELIQPLPLSLLAAVTFVFCYFTVPPLRMIAEKFDALDIPNDRSLHNKPIARVGGIPLALTAITSTVFLLIPSNGPVSKGCVWTYVVTATILAIVGLVDDIHSLARLLRFAAQSACAVALVAYCLTYEGNRSFLVAAFFFVWITGMTNAFNFMDGIDGIAGGQAAVAGAGWTMIGLQQKDQVVAVLGTVIAAGAIGFLLHNWTPATIFMGDSGSVFLGFTFAVMPVLSNQSLGKALTEAALLVWPFLFDATFTLIRRLFHRENIFAAHRKHIYQRLVLAGFSHARVSTTYITLALLGAVGAGLVSEQHFWLATFVTAMIVILAACLATSVWLMERRSRPAALAEKV